MKLEKKIQPEKQEGLTGPDLRLQRFLTLQEQIKALTEELEGIKEEIRHQGTFSTSHFVATVEERTRTVAPSRDVLVRAFGPQVEALYGETTYKIVKVSRKEGIK